MKIFSNLRFKLTIIFFYVFIVYLFFCSIYNNLPVNEMNCKHKTGTVDEINLITFKGPDYLTVIIDSEKFVLGNFNPNPSLDIVQYIYENFDAGDIISIKYNTQLKIYRTSKHIVEITINGITLSTVDEYNQIIKGLSTMFFILFIIFEFFNIGVYIFFKVLLKPVKKKKSSKS